MEKKMTGEIEKKLDVLIKLTASSLIKEDSSQKESTLRLFKIGLSNKDIAQILNKEENYVRAIISVHKNKYAKKQKN